MPLTVCGFDLTTFWLFMVLNVLHSVLDHGGYELPFSPLSLIPFSGYVDTHTFHHTRNVECYSLYFPWLWDALMGTDRSYKDYLKQEDAFFASLPPAVAART